MNGEEARAMMIAPEELRAPSLLLWWEYLVPDPGTALGLSPFGDWFLEDRHGAVWRLDILEGSFELLVPSVAAFWEGLGEERGQDEWLQAGHVLALQQRGHIRARGQCYTYRVHPRLGGKIGIDNMELGQTAGWQMFCAQLHAQLDALPHEAVVTSLDCDPEGRVTVRWRA